MVSGSQFEHERSGLNRATRHQREEPGQNHSIIQSTVSGILTISPRISRRLAWFLVPLGLASSYTLD